MTSRYPNQEPQDDAPRYDVFHRTWWKTNPTWPRGLEPCPGRRTYIARNVTQEAARRIADEYNQTHRPGKLSRKAEWTRR